jgi:RNA polymerase sigma-70 factor, ECF subfamily
MVPPAVASELPASEAARAAQKSARDSYGRLLAYLAYRWRDIAAAQDALAEAFASALQSWPRSGVPDSPDAWLMTAAKRNLLQMQRHAGVAADPAVAILLADDDAVAIAAPLIPDERLKLLFVCAHPAIDPAARTPLMLQTVLGLEARQIASAFLVSPTAMAQRLVRAKIKIRQAGIGFEAPEASELPERTHAVLEAIYAAYGLGWEAATSDTLGSAPGSNLVEESIYLADLTATLLPDSAEAAGLLALLLLCESRQAARYGSGGEFMPLHLQDCALWNKTLIQQADQILWAAAARRQPGPFQLEAAIQAAHCHRVYTGNVPWSSIATLYQQLIHIGPTLGALVGRAVALGEAGTARDGLSALEEIDHSTVETYQPYWVAQAYLLAKDGQRAQAVLSYQRAMGLTAQAAVRSHLQHQLRAIASKPDPCKFLPGSTLAVIPAKAGIQFLRR